MTWWQTWWHRGGGAADAATNCFEVGGVLAGFFLDVVVVGLPAGNNFAVVCFFKDFPMVDGIREKDTDYERLMRQLNNILRVWQ